MNRVWKKRTRIGVRGRGAGAALKFGLGLCLVARLAQAREPSAKAALRDGLKAYREERFEEALSAFESAAKQSERARLDPAIAHYNRGNSSFRLRRPEEAQDAYREALRTLDARVQQHASYNRGNALALRAQALQQAGQLEQALASVDEALAMYENALRLDPSDQDAKINYELAWRLREQLEQLRQQAPSSPQTSPQPRESAEPRAPEQKQPSDDQKEQAPSSPESAAQPPAPAPSEEMTPEEARMLLDAMRQEEQTQREKLRMFLGEPVPVEKDW